MLFFIAAKDMFVRCLDNFLIFLPFCVVLSNFAVDLFSPLSLSDLSPFPNCSVWSSPLRHCLHGVRLDAGCSRRFADRMGRNIQAF